MHAQQAWQLALLAFVQSFHGVFRPEFAHWIGFLERLNL
jgi:hypothetical protein